MPLRPRLDTDRPLIDSVVAGAPEAIDEFIRQFSRFVYWSARHDTRLGRQDANYVTQRVFINLLEEDCRRLRTWHGTAFEPFLREVVYDEALSLARIRPGLEPPHEDDLQDDEDLHGLPLADADLEGEALLTGVRTLIRKCYETLTVEQQRIVSCLYEDKLDQRSIAAIFGLTEDTAAQRLSQATRALRDCLSTKLGDRPWVLM